MARVCLVGPCRGRRFALLYPFTVPGRFSNAASELHVGLLSTYRASGGVWRCSGAGSLLDET